MLLLYFIIRLVDDIKDTLIYFYTFDKNSFYSDLIINSLFKNDNIHLKTLKKGTVQNKNSKIM